MNPIALKRIEKLFCKNERAVIETRLAATGDLAHAGAGGRHPGRQHPPALPGRSRSASCGPNVIACSAAYRKGDEMGWFEHGSTIVVLAPETLSLAAGVETGTVIRQGQPLLRLQQR